MQRTVLRYHFFVTISVNVPFYTWGLFTHNKMEKIIDGLPPHETALKYMN